MTTENATEFLRENKLPFYRVTKGEKVCFRSPETEDGTPASADSSVNVVEHAIEHFRKNIDLYPPGKYSIHARKTFKSTAQENIFYFGKDESAKVEAVHGVGNYNEQFSPDRIGELIAAKMDKVSAEYEKRFAEYEHKRELEKRDDEIKRLKEEIKDKPAFGMDKITQAIAGIQNLVSMSSGRPVAGGLVTAPVAGTPQPPRQAHTAHHAPQRTEAEPDEEVGRIQAALEKMHQVAGENFTPGLEALASVAERSPAEFNSYIAMLQNQ